MVLFCKQHFLDEPTEKINLMDETLIVFSLQILMKPLLCEILYKHSDIVAKKDLCTKEDKHK